MAKQDFYSYCRKHEGFELSVQELHDVWCFRCQNPECSRSTNGTSRFEDRVKNWERDKFLSPARLDPSDSRFQDITAKRFLNVMPSDPGKSSSWNDPRDLSSSSVSVPEALATPTLPLIDLPEVPFMPIPEAPVATVQPVTPQQPQAKPAVTAQPKNTPNRPRQMIGGAEQKAEAPVLDPWQPKQALKPGETLVKPGAKIKLGG